MKKRISKLSKRINREYFLFQNKKVNLKSNNKILIDFNNILLSNIIYIEF